jgi:probable F420-dependent oxidoreductase
LRLSIFAFALEPGDYAPVARRADELGFDAIWLAEHLITPLSYSSRYPYSDSGDPGYRPDTPLSDVLVVASHIAAVTEQLRIGTGVYILPLRNPFVSALAAATAQNLSGGRFLFGVGSGWMAEEYAAVGEPFEARGARMDEILDLFAGLWTGQPVAHHGRFYDFPSVQFGAAPEMPVPIVMGGVSAPAMRRAATRGDGFFGPNCSLEDSLRHRARVEELRADAGRSGRPFEYHLRLEGAATPDNLARHEAAGIENAVISAWRAGHRSDAPSLQQRLDDLERIAEAAAPGGHLKPRA